MCDVKTLMTPYHTAFQVSNFGWGQAGVGRSSGEGLNTGRHEKAPVRGPFMRLAAIHGAPRTLVLPSHNEAFICNFY